MKRMYRPRQILVEEEETSKNQLLREEEKDITTRSSSSTDDGALDPYTPIRPAHGSENLGYRGGTPGKQFCLYL